MLNRLIKQSISLILMALCIVFTVGCSNDNETTQSQYNTAYVVEDARGKKIEFAKPPTRIMSMYPGSDEILVNMVEPERILALSKWAEDEQISNVMHMADKIKLRTEYNVEYILKHNPDVIFMRETSNMDFIEQLENVGVKVFVYPNAKNLEEVKNIHTIFGNVLKTEEKAREINEKIDKDVKKLLSERHDTNAKVLIFNSRGAMSTKGSLLGSVFGQLGIENMADRYNVPPGTVLNKEQVVDCDPDVFIVIDWSDGGYFPSGDIKLKEMYSDPSLKELKAIKNKRLILLPIKYISCGSIYVTSSCYEILKIVKK